MGPPVREAGGSDMSAAHHLPRPPRRDRVVEVPSPHRPHRPAAHARRARPMAGNSANGSAARRSPRVLSSPLIRAERTAELAGLHSRDRAGSARMGLRRIRGKNQRRDSHGPAGLGSIPRRPPGGESVAAVAGRVDRLVGEVEGTHRQRATASRTATSCGCWPRGGSVSRSSFAGSPVTRHRDRERPRASTTADSDEPAIKVWNS